MNNSTGKIFKDSSNIYQDQAKILFDYYKAAAETIVCAEMNEERNKAELIKQRDEMNARGEKARKMSIVMFAMFFLVIPIIIGFVYRTKQSNCKKEVARFNELIAQCEERYRNIRREYKVDKIGVVYIPVATRVPFEDKSIILDHTGSVGETNFNLTVLNQPEEFQSAVQQLSDALNKLPVVEDNSVTETVNTSDYSTSIQNITLYDYMGNIDRQVRNIRYLLGESSNASVKIPVIAPDSSEAKYLSEYSTTNPGSHNVVKVFGISFDDRLAKFASLNALKDQIKNTGDSDSNEYIKRFMRNLAESVHMLTKAKMSSQSKLVDYTSKIFNVVLKAGYTQYSPTLEAEEIERVRAQNIFEYHTAVNDYSPFVFKASSIVKYELFSESWIAEDGSRTSMPFGMHQIDEEIIMPVIAALMEENRVERMKIYNSIDDQKRMYVDRWKTEVGNYFRDNRKTADELITHMRETYADYMNAYNMYQSLVKTSSAMKQSGSIADSEVEEIDSQAEMLAGFDTQASQCNQQQEAFAEFLDRINDSIDESTKEFEYIEYYEGSLRDTMAHETAVAFSVLHDLNSDNRRRNLIKVSPYIANNAVLLPEPVINPEVFDSIQTDLLQKVNEAVGQFNTAATEETNTFNV